jgi:hypothetical protein
VTAFVWWRDSRSNLPVCSRSNLDLVDLIYSGVDLIYHGCSGVDLIYRGVPGSNLMELGGRSLTQRWERGEVEAMAPKQGGATDRWKRREAQELMCWRGEAPPSLYRRRGRSHLPQVAPPQVGAHPKTDLGEGQNPSRLPPSLLPPPPPRVWGVRTGEGAGPFCLGLAGPSHLGCP